MDSDPSSSPSAARVVLHVGAPKSGTTFLQKAMWANREQLTDAGFALPGERQRDMFLAAVEVREAYRVWGYGPDQIDGTWRRLCAAAREHRGTTVMSHELLGAATDAQVDRALAELDGVELHVVFTARDLARQATSEWQERIKNGSRRPFRAFQDELEGQIRAADYSGSFWRHQDAAGALERWARHLPASHVHVVVAPAPGAEPDVLWRRFADAVGLDADAYDPFVDEEPTNQTLGVAQVAVLRRVNAALGKQIPQPGYARVVKDYFVDKQLAQQQSPKPVCPERLAALLRTVAEERNAEFTRRGYRSYGDLTELLPEPDPDAPPPDQVDLVAELEVFAQAVATSLVMRDAHRLETLRRREDQQRLAAERAAMARPTLLRRIGNRLRR